MQILETAFDMLAESPKTGQNIDYIRHGYFRYTVGKHVIFYHFVSDTDIEVVRILHQSMDVESHLS